MGVLMKVSVIVTTFNREKLLQETLDAILNQTFKDFELIIIDNYSLDNTKEVVKSYNDDRIRYFKNQNDGIIAINRNFGIKKSKGEYIAFCDDDDLWMPDKLEKQLSEFEKDAQIGLVCTNGVNFNENGDFGLLHKRSLNDNDFKLESLVFENPIVNSSILIKKSVIDDVGMMDEEPEFFGAEDYSLWIRTTKKYRIKYIDLPLTKYRTHLGAYRNDTEKSLAVTERIYGKLLKNGIIDIELYKRATGRLNYKHLILRLVNNDNTLDLETILQIKMGYMEKCRLIPIYFLFRAGMLNTLRHMRHNLLHTY